jgi:DNA segregation ATPase FtsK/SpoIIIE-like protein
MTGGGYNAEFGFSNGSDETANFQKTVVEQSRKNVLMMPSKKIGFNSFIKVCDANKFDTLITDWDTVEDELAKIEELGVKVVIAEQEEDNNTIIKEETDEDSIFKAALEIALEIGNISTSMLQRKLSIGYTSASRIIDKMVEMNIIVMNENSKRSGRVVITKQDFIEMYE